MYFFINISHSGTKLVFFDIGQGDAVLLESASGHTIIFDGGPDNLVLQGLGQYLPFYQRKIDYLVISHYHDDHIIGLVEVVKRYQVNNLIYSGKKSSSLNFIELLRVARAYNVKLIEVQGQLRVDLDSSCSLRLIDPESLVIKEDANNSVTAKINCGGRTVLLAGDNADFVERALLQIGWLEDINIFKASHHGSNTSNSWEFLEVIKPELIVISVGVDNRYGHPGGQFLERASNLRIPVKRTDLEGSIEILLK